MEQKFKVGNTYVADGFSNSGSVVKATVVRRTDMHIVFDCDVLFDKDVRRKVSVDSDGDEVVSLNRKYKVCAANLDKKASAVNEAKQIQRAILEDDFWMPSEYSKIQDMVIEETDEGIRFVNSTKYQPEMIDMRGEEWMLDQPIETVPMKVVNMTWGSGCKDFPTCVVAYIPKDCIDCCDEGEAVMHAVFDALKSKGFFYHPSQIDDMNLLEYDLQECDMGYDFNPDDEMGFGGR